LRNQKLRDAALLLPLIGTFLMLPVVLRLISGGHLFADLPSLPAFLYLVWFGLIVAAAVLARLLLKAEAYAESSQATVLETEEGGR
jgi:hypothetical protein